MKMTYEHKLAFKITIILLLLYIFSFWIFISLNYKLSLDREKHIFLDNLKSVPSKYIINLLEGNSPHYWRSDWKGPWNAIYKKLFQNFYIKIWEKEYSKWFFDENYIKEKIVDNLDNKEIKVFRFFDEKILAYKVSLEDITLIIWKDVSYIFEAIHRLVFIALFLTIISAFLLYYISLKLAYKTTKNIKIANKKLREYNYNVAHELKTPLSVIKSDLELLEITWKIDKEVIESSKQEVGYMQEIIDSLLFLSENELVLEKDNILLKDEIKDIIWKYFEENKKDFIIKIPNDIKILFNKKLFDILLKNLIENALKYRWRPKKIYIDFTNNKLIFKNKIHKDIKNIDENKVFDTFYKADSSRTGKWFWLGLNIVKKVVELHNYDIKVEIKDKFFIISIIF